MTIVEAFKKLGIAMTGEEPVGDNIADVISALADIVAKQKEASEGQG